jgi:hypothetical protein
MSSENVPRRKRGLALAMAGLVFVTGMAAGVAVDRLIERGGAHDGERKRWGRRPEERAAKYRVELGLDDRQARAVEGILRRSWAATRAIIEPIDPQIDAVRRQGDREIRALLRDDQVARFDAIVADQERRRAAFREGVALPRRKGGGER